MLPPSAAVYSEQLAYNHGAYSWNNTTAIFSGNYSGYYLPGKGNNNSVFLNGALWLLMLQKTRNVCSDKPFPSGNTFSLVDEVLVPGACTRYQVVGKGGLVCNEWAPATWQKQTTPLYVQSPSSSQRLKEPSNIGNYQMYQEWFACMTNYTEAYDPATQSYANYTKNREFINCGWWGGVTHDDNAGFGGNGRGGNKHEERFNGCARGNLALSKDGCSLIPQSEVARLCGSDLTRIEFYGYSDTPISLLLDPSYDIHNNMSIVEFPLSDRVGTRFWTWKGSSKAPLLVYDPEHSGRIESAKQLFGPSTFGGKTAQGQFRQVRLSGEESRYWKHGFEALGSLDVNSDGKISGEELRPLALWFDADQDAVSDEGEVTTLDRAGITELFYSPDIVDEKNRSIEVSRGFTRVVNGVPISGRAIDWGAEGSNSQFDLMKKHVEFAPAADASRDRASDVVTDSSIENPFQNGKEPAQAESLPGSDGIWKWSLNQSEEVAGRSGYFILSSRNGVVSGSTFSDLTLGHQEDGKINLFELLQFNTLNGSQVFDQTGRSTVTFKVTVKDGHIRNTADMSPDGLSMTGSSVATIDGTDSKKVIKYSWTAKKQG
jgi:hypothetical protein